MSRKPGAKEVLSLLRSKNRCLEEFLAVTASFWEKARHGELSELPDFESQRDASLRAIDLYDRKISELASRIDSSERTEAVSAAVRSNLSEREALVHRILELDLKIMGKIEEAKNLLLKDMAQVRKGKEALGKFRSEWLAQSGEEFDQKV